MKLLENSNFEAVNHALSQDISDYKIDGRIESYSCKMAGQDKRLYKNLSIETGTPDTLHALSSPQSLEIMMPGHSPGR